MEQNKKTFAAAAIGLAGAGAAAVWAKRHWENYAAEHSVRRPLSGQRNRYL